MFFAYVIIILIVSLFTFIVYGVDKDKASNHSKNRIPEIVLLSLTAMGGAFGALFAIKKIRHKSKMFHFLAVMFVSLIIQIVLLFVLLLA